ncbi:DUF3301 domain-containing protein [Marinomonas algarum]|uniref:DUF3301 domain-containing protein n=1 Tax=Marinomonas algarum TaxID=2883105 RepID=A0A9X1LE32_9GAMM|nr:DUF3301 domain-containing protein [Marinomonas algarum]MCB5160676.1 DUF3301 domain-containing protein [Marinomonas algarum]
MNLQLIDIVVFLALASVLYAWWCNITIREQALKRAKKHCESLNLQLLDGSVAGSGWRPVWHSGMIKVKRRYTFEFSSSGTSRYSGEITYLGNQQLSIWLSPHDF